MTGPTDKSPRPPGVISVAYVKGPVQDRNNILECGTGIPQVFLRHRHFPVLCIFAKFVPLPGQFRIHLRERTHYIPYFLLRPMNRQVVACSDDADTFSREYLGNSSELAIYSLKYFVARPEHIE